jgi:hypothetical protein
MPVEQELLDQIEAALTATVSPSLTAASAANDLFEAFIWSLVIEAAREEGGTVQFFDLNGSPVNTFVFRSSPSSIFSNVNPYSYAHISFPGCPELEAHQGIYVTGKSGVLHECDVVVLDHAEADICRNSSVHPRTAKAVLAAECKFYSTNLRLHLARSFLGLTEEILQGDRFFVSNTNATSVTKMLTYHHRKWEVSVEPSNLKFRNRLRTDFETSFKHYRARHA